MSALADISDLTHYSWSPHGAYVGMVLFLEDMLGQECLRKKGGSWNCKGMPMDPVSSLKSRLRGLHLVLWLRGDTLNSRVRSIIRVGGLNAGAYLGPSRHTLNEGGGVNE